MMTCESFEAVASAYLDGDVPPESRAAADAHLARCAACSALVADLRRIARDARAMREMAPSRDLWPAIEARIAARVIPLGEAAAGVRGEHAHVEHVGVPPTDPLRVEAHEAGAASAAHGSSSRAGGFTGRTWQLSTRRLAAAAAVLIAVTAGTTWLASRQNGPAAGAAGTGPWVVTGAPAALEGGAQSTPWTAIDRTYDAEIRALRAVIAERRAELDSATVATIERSLRLIDDAIAESRAALARDPANDFLHEQLDRTLARKVELMQALARMPARS